jgi:hypothetical protein
LNWEDDARTLVSRKRPRARQHLHLPRSENAHGCGRVFPGWMPWRRFALSPRTFRLFAQVRKSTKCSGTLSSQDMWNELAPTRTLLQRIHERPRERRSPGAEIHESVNLRL